MRTSEQLNELYGALAQARMLFGPVAKTKTAITKGNRPYSYAPLEGVLDAIIPALGAHGLALIGGLDADDAGGLVVLTRLGHTSGQYLEIALPIGRAETMHDLGTRLTYARRYSICLLVQVQAEEDTDGAGESSEDGEPSEDLGHLVTPGIKTGYRGFKRREAEMKADVDAAADGAAPPAHPTPDQLSSLIELVKSCGVDAVAFGNYLRGVMGLEGKGVLGLAYMRANLTMPQYDIAWAHYAEQLKQQVEAEVTEEPPAVPFASSIPPIADPDAGGSAASATPNAHPSTGDTPNATASNTATGGSDEEDVPMYIPPQGQTPASAGDSPPSARADSSGPSQTSAANLSDAAQTHGDQTTGRPREMLATDAQQAQLTRVAESIGPEAVTWLKNKIDEAHGRLTRSQVPSVNASLERRRSMQKLAQAD